MPMLKEVQIQEACMGYFTPQEPLWGLFNALAIVRGVWAPFFDAIPSLLCNPFFPLKSLPGAIMDEMFWVATMVAAFFFCLGILNSPCQVYHELFCNSFDSTRIITPLVFIITSVLLFQMHQMLTRLFQDGLVALEFPQGEETGSPWFGRSNSCQVLGPWGNSMESSFLVSQVAFK